MPLRAVGGADIKLRGSAEVASTWDHTRMNVPEGASAAAAEITPEMIEAGVYHPSWGSIRTSTKGSNPPT
jgi:hypothetical protein